MRLIIFQRLPPKLTEVLALRREEGAALADGGDVYDALLDGYETSIKATEIETMFGAMRPRLVALRRAVLDQPAPEPLAGYFESDLKCALPTTWPKPLGTI